MSCDVQEEDILPLSLLVGNKETWRWIGFEGSMAYTKTVSHLMHTVKEKTFGRLSEHSKVYCLRFIQNTYKTSAPFFFLFYSMQSKSVWDLVEHVTDIQYKLLFQQLGPRAV